MMVYYSLFVDLMCIVGGRLYAGSKGLNVYCQAVCSPTSLLLMC